MRRWTCFVFAATFVWTVKSEIWSKVGQVRASYALVGQEGDVCDGDELYRPVSYYRAELQVSDAANLVNECLDLCDQVRTATSKCIGVEVSSLDDKGMVYYCKIFDPEWVGTAADNVGSIPELRSGEEGGNFIYTSFAGQRLVNSMGRRAESNVFAAAPFPNSDWKSPWSGNHFSACYRREPTCTTATNCNSLNRYECKYGKTDNQCGACRPRYKQDGSGSCNPDAAAPLPQLRIGFLTGGELFSLRTRHKDLLPGMDDSVGQQGSAFRATNFGAMGSNDGMRSGLSIAVMSKYAFLQPFTSDDTQPGNFMPIKKYFSAPGKDREKQSFGIQFGGYVTNFNHLFWYNWKDKRYDNYSYNVVNPVSPLSGLISVTGSPRHTDFVNHLGYTPFDGGKRPHVLLNALCGDFAGLPEYIPDYMEQVAVQTIGALQTPLLTYIGTRVVWADKSLHEYYVRNVFMSLEITSSLLTILKQLGYTMAFVITAAAGQALWYDALVAAAPFGITMDPRSPRTWPTPESCTGDLPYLNPCINEWFQQWQYVRDYDVRVVLHQGGNIKVEWAVYASTNQVWDFWFKMVYINYNMAPGGCAKMDWLWPLLQMARSAYRQWGVWRVGADPWGIDNVDGFEPESGVMGTVGLEKKKTCGSSSPCLIGSQNESIRAKSRLFTRDVLTTPNILHIDIPEKPWSGGEIGRRTGTWISRQVFEWTTTQLDGFQLPRRGTGLMNGCGLGFNLIGWLSYYYWANTGCMKVTDASFTCKANLTCGNSYMYSSARPCSDWNPNRPLFGEENYAPGNSRDGRWPNYYYYNKFHAVSAAYEDMWQPGPIPDCDGFSCHYHNPLIIFSSDRYTADAPRSQTGRGCFDWVDQFQKCWHGSMCAEFEVVLDAQAYDQIINILSCGKLSCLESSFPDSVAHEAIDRMIALGVPQGYFETLETREDRWLTGRRRDDGVGGSLAALRTQDCGLNCTLTNMFKNECCIKKPWQTTGFFSSFSDRERW
jgi:hypothetical protein